VRVHWLTLPQLRSTVIVNQRQVLVGEFTCGVVTMSLLTVVAGSAIVLLVAYVTYGRFLSRFLQLDASRPTPAVEMRDGIDYDPIEPKFLMSQHFSAIAAAGPIVGPILAGVMFGWLPALVWILVGAIFIGGVHDMAALAASIRHKARSIAEVVREHMSQRSYVLFLMFIWIALVYIIVAFTDITAASFIGVQTLENGEQVTGGGIATSSLLYLALPIVMGLLLRHTRLSLGWATVIFLPLVAVAIWLGQKIPLDLATLLGITDSQAHKLWDVLLLGYCLVAAVVPVWLLLQPRGHLGGYFLYFALAGGCIGVLFGGHDVQYPAFTAWTIPSADGLSKGLAPFLFITIACGACSGFHALIASGTTSKQLRVETDARPIAYGAMLLEGMVAVLSLCCVMIHAPGVGPLSGEPKPNFVYASGLGNFLGVLKVPHAFAVSFALMAFTTFVYDTLDVCTRLGRYIVQELTGLADWRGRWLGTGLTAGVPVYFVLNKIEVNGKEQPVWRMFWDLFGASNQLLAALTLLGITVWLWRTRRNPLVWLVTGVPTVLMYVMSLWALVELTLPKFYSKGQFLKPTDPVAWAGVVLIALAALMLVEAVRVILGPQSPPTPMKPALAS
jgi:carbon starvation protein